MNELYYCEKHLRAYEVQHIPGAWWYGCPDCLKEGAYKTYATTKTTMKPADEWTTSTNSKQPVTKGDSENEVF